MTNNINNLHVLIQQVRADEILLPDFQRKFVWSDVERKQKKLVASVLSWLPLGSLLLLDGESNEFVAKQLGRKLVVEQGENQNKKFLLDGQQRLTVLTNVFSNVIFDSLSHWSNLSSDSLKYRFFLKFKFENYLNVIDKIDKGTYPNSEDIFGLSNLRFPFNPQTSEPQFLTEDVIDYIYAQTVRASDTYNPFHPQFDYTSAGSETKLSSACYISDLETGEEFFLLPLFLKVGPNQALSDILLKKLVGMQESLLMDIYNHSDHEKKKERFGKIFPRSSSTIHRNLPSDFAEKPESFSQFLKFATVSWASHYKDYLDKCVAELKVNVMVVSKAQRARAIDIYENLNQGGVSLDTFDLIIAKAAKSMKEGFYDAFINSVKKSVDVPVFYEGYYESTPQWNADTSLGLYNEDKNQIASTYVDVFLNLLSLVNNVALKEENGRSNVSNIRIELIKKEEILALSSDQVINTYENVTRALNRALSFLQLNCGVRKMDDISYDHIILGLSYFLYFDDVFKSKNKTRVLEYWYWSSLLSGRYDKDQNSNIIADLKIISNVLFNNSEIEKLKERKTHVFNLMNFSDKGTLLLDYAEFDRLPKDVIRKTICQYVLKNKPKDVLEDKSLNAWDNFDLDYHHIIPLKSALDIKESTSELRKNKKSILNSPLNYTLITHQSNLLISGYSIDHYFDSITRSALSSHFLPEAMEIANEDHARVWLEERFIRLKTEFEKYLDKLEAEF